ncbi:carboxypeptidase-like regulatory domain-containing protein [Sphingobacterium sp. CZ-2]|uniref:carboxypeptidase-like regulatory domain-containing protein n=1 Tax=Sphingobacterium sp. CZ-2 TaxID=2557994 RepID=UPI0010703584|nr:carboxypeptidase-like regulatory domain-containing protein [Sphingobacterium sp. CZ-2]QBR12870.1 hypothetical protein E3D81_12135 [Sphingobacterium sp. CZ-2]
MLTFLNKDYASFYFVFGLCFILQLCCIKDSSGANLHIITSEFHSKNLKTTNTSVQQTSTITGIVTNTAGKPIPGATISIPKLGLSTSTDKDGKYSLDLPTGEHL